MSIFGAALGAVASIAGGIYQNKQNRENADVAFQRQRQLINEANIYNAPVNQMERLKQAGLNPHLIYGNGAGNMVSATAGTPPAPHSENIMQNIGIYATMQQVKNQSRALDLQEREIALKEKKSTSEIELNLSQAEKHKSDSELNVQTIYNLMQDREFKSQLHELNKVSIHLQNDMYKFDFEQKKVLAPFIKLNHILQNKTLSNNIRVNNLRLAIDNELKNNTIRLTDSQIKKIGSEYSLNVQEREFLNVYNDCKLTVSQWEAVKASSKLNDVISPGFRADLENAFELIGKIF